MTDPSAHTSSVGALDEQAIRERVRDLTAQMLSTGRLDGEGIKEVVRAMGIGSAPAPAIDDEQAGLAARPSLLRNQGVGEIEIEGGDERHRDAIQYQNRSASHSASSG